MVGVQVWKEIFNSHPKMYNALFFILSSYKGSLTIWHLTIPIVVVPHR